MRRPGTSPARYVGLPSWRLTRPPTAADLHAGVLADVLAGYQRLRGRDAVAETLLVNDGAPGSRPASFREAWSALGLSGRSISLAGGGKDIFEDHPWPVLKERGDLYIGHYEGWFCEACARFYADYEIHDGPSCRRHPQSVAKVDSDCWIFRLARYRVQLTALYDHVEAQPDGVFVMPGQRMRELRRWVAESLVDVPLCLAGPAPSSPRQPRGAAEAAAVHAPIVALASSWTSAASSVNYVIPGELAWHCAVVWPAMLMAAGYPPHGVIVYDAPPRTVPPAMIHDLGADAFRYLLLRRPAGDTDAEFGTGLLDHYSAELAYGLTNLVARTTAMAAGPGTACTIPRPERPEDPFSPELTSISREVAYPQDILDCAGSLVRAGNAYIEERQPWTQPSSERARTLWHVFELCRVVAQLTAPVFPETARKLLAQLGVMEPPHWPAWGGYQDGFQVSRTAEPLFPAITAARQRRLLTDWAGKAGESRPDARISPQDFGQLDLRVAKIASAEYIPAGDRAVLLKIVLDLGTEERTVISSALAGEYTPTSLAGRMVAYLANLPPVRIAGFVSQGMILAAHDGEATSILAVDQDPELGTVMF